MGESDRTEDGPPTVVVFGATVAGLTAAHETALRGFDVTVLVDADESLGEPLGSGWMPRKRIVPFQARGEPFPSSAPVPEEIHAAPFPTAYRHLLETLAAIPSGDDGGSLADQLVEQTWRTLRTPDSPIPICGVAPSRNIDQMLDGAKLFSAAGYSPPDGHTFIARLIRYLSTSSDRRAAECQTVSMLDYLCGANAPAVARNCEYSSAFLSELAAIPDLMLGIRPSVTDARTALSWYVQWLGGTPGSNGPKHVRFGGSLRETWFEPWRTYLGSALGVRFLDANLKALEPLFGARTAGSPGAPSGVAARVGGGSPATRQLVDRADYLIVATSPSAAAASCAALPPVGIPGQLRGFCAPSVASRRRARDGQRASGEAAHRFQPVGGVQLFLPARLDLDGPLSVAGSPWKLTLREHAVLHPRAPVAARDGFGCVVTVDIGAWDEPAPRTTRAPVACDGRALAQEVWRQIEDAGVLKRGKARKSGGPRWFALDSRVGVRRAGVRELARGLVCLPGDWAARPGPEPSIDASSTEGRGRRAPVWRASEGGSWIHWGRLAFAGAYLKTRTRLDCVEGACESGRDAANAIISHARTFRAHPARGAPRTSRPKFARTWDPEAHEVESLASLREVDDWCARERLPHPFELAGLDSWISLVSWFGVLYPVSGPFFKTVLEKLRTMARPAHRAHRPTDYQEAALDILKKLREALERSAKR